MFFKNKCTNCGKEFSRLPWGGRLHRSSRGTGYIHPIDYVVTFNEKTNEDKKEQIAKLEEIERRCSRIGTCG